MTRRKADRVAAERLCPECGQPMLPPGEVKRENEYDHAQGCPLDTNEKEAPNG